MLEADSENIMEKSMGSMLIGVIFSGVLYGISLLQTFFYYTTYSKDAWYLKALVVSTVVFDTAHLACLMHSMYHYLVSSFLHVENLQFLVWSLVIEAVFTGLTGAFVQLFYLFRIWQLSKHNWLLSLLVLVIIIGNAGCGIAWVVLAMEAHTFERLLKINNLTITINALSTAADVLIAGSLCLLLHRSRTGFKQSDTLINKLILFIVNTGVLTSFCALASLISLLVSPRTLIYACFYFCIGRFYTNSLLAALNARNALKHGSGHNSEHMMVSFQPNAASVSPMGAVRKPSPANISIRIDTRESIHDDQMINSTHSHIEFSHKNMPL